MEKSVFRFFAAVLSALVVFAAFGQVSFAASDLVEYPLQVPQSTIRSADFSPDGRSLALGVLRLGKKSGKDVPFTDAVAIWDLKSREMASNVAFDSGTWNPSCLPQFLHYMSDGHRVALLEGGAVTVLDSTSPKEITRIDLGLPPQPGPPGVPTPWVVDMKVAPVGNRIAVLITYLPTFRSGKLRIYDVETKRMVWEWSFQEDVNGYSLTFSPDAMKIAVTQPIARTGTSLLVLDINSSREVLRLSNGKNSPTSEVVFASNTELITTAWMNDHTHRGIIQFRDINSGKVTREITAAPEGVHGFVDLSRDGRYLIGYVGLEKTVQHFTETVDERFRIWELSSGKVIATSPDLPRPHQSMTPELRFSPDGRRVIAYWPESYAPAQIFELTGVVAGRAVRDVLFRASEDPCTPDIRQCGLMLKREP
jgi:WD40 repeat protein